MNSNEIGSIALGVLIAFWVINEYGYDSSGSLVAYALAWIGILITIGYNWGKWIQKRRMESNDE